MASESERVDQFQQILNQIGGKSNIHLCSAASGPDGNTVVLQDFIADMFHDGRYEEISGSVGNSNGEIKIQTAAKLTDASIPDQQQCDLSEQNSSIPADGEKTDPLKNKTVISSRNISGQQRAIKCSMVVFIFRHDYVCNKDNYLCLREIMKDVRARIKRNVFRPALLGLIHTDCDRSEIRESLELLDGSLRSVFITHTQQAIWTGRYVTDSPKVLEEIKRNACKAVNSAMSVDSSAGSKNSSFWPLKCLPGILLKEQRGHADLTSGSWQQVFSGHSRAFCEEQTIIEIYTSTNLLYSLMVLFVILGFDGFSPHSFS
ncbi:uncharacterized protein LOC127640930 [Xyrauchen texanus]|uniref:uncharacterized protein LOC127640930 n=1 Tax=Xyrauchen texanus TaxID=154827 RepID=UPI0022422E62|nr:uncharacterized protein LOC127640930 [Xyrauchen texanus]